MPPAEKLFYISPPIPDALATSDAAGNFSVRVEDSGPIDLVAEKPGEAWGVVADWKPGAPIKLLYRFATRIKFENVDGGPLKRLAVSARRIPYIMNRARDCDRIRDTPESLAMAQVEHYSGTTDDDGTIVLHGVVGGFYRVITASPERGEYQTDLSFRDVEALTIVVGERGRLEGRVLADESNAPIAGARARIVALEDGFRALSRDAVTDADGRFVLEGAVRSLGPLFVSIQAGGFANALEPLPEFRYAPEVRRTIRVSPPAKISGVVVDQTGKPIAGAHVSVRRPEHVATTTEEHDVMAIRVAEAETDTAGKFTIQCVPAGGPLELSAQADGHGPGRTVCGERGELHEPIVLQRSGAILLSTSKIEPPSADQTHFSVLLRNESIGLRRAVDWFAKIQPIASPQPLRLDTEGPGRYRISINVPGRPSRNDIIVDVAGADDVPVLADLSGGLEVRGRVVDRAGRPIAGIAVWPLTPAAPDEPYGQRTVHEAKTDADGRFTLGGLRDGWQDIFLQLESDAETYAHNFHLWLHGDGGSQDLGELRVPRVASLAGTVVSDGAAPKGLYVRVVNAARRVLQLRDVDAGGAFVFDKFVAGNYTLEVCCEELPSTVLASAHVELAEEQKLQITLALGRARVKGVVRGAAARGGAMISVRRCDDGAIAATQRADAEGKFAFDYLPAGCVEFAAASDAAANVDCAVERVQLVEGSNDVVLEPASTRLEVIVRDTAGAAVNDVEISIAPSDGAGGSLVRAFTDAQGRAAFAALPPRDYCIRARKEAFERCSLWTTHVGASGGDRLAVTLERQSTLRVRVNGASGAAEPLARVELRDVDRAERVPIALETDSFGTAHFAALSGGKYRVEVKGARLGLPTPDTVVLAPESAREIAVSLRGTASLKARVSDAKGNPLAGVHVVVTADSVAGTSDEWLARGWISATRRATSAPDGVIEFAGLPPGNLTVQAEGGTASLVPLKADGSAEVVLAMQ